MGIISFQTSSSLKQNTTKKMNMRCLMGMKTSLLLLYSWTQLQCTIRHKIQRRAFRRGYKFFYANTYQHPKLTKSYQYHRPDSSQEQCKILTQFKSYVDSTLNGKGGGVSLDFNTISASSTL